MYVWLLLFESVLKMQHLGLHKIYYRVPSVTRLHKPRRWYLSRLQGTRKITTYSEVGPH
jgi:hypothetical protein